jgi:ferredoxin-NADP reductase
VGVVAGNEVETARARRIRLDVDGWEGHLPGQHVDVRLTAADGYQAQRSYSIASAPDDATLDLIVARHDDGEVSPYLTDVLEPGDPLELRGPIGHYFVWHRDHGGPLQLIAGGAGVAPLLAMLDHRAQTSAPVPARLLYSAQHADDIIARNRLEEHAARGVDVAITLTRRAPPAWTGLTGRATRQMLADHVWPPEEQPRVYVCGPTAFVEAVADTLVDLGHPPQTVRTERFG